MTSIDEFWGWFAANATDLRDEEDGDAVCDAITEELAKVHAGLVGEIERGGAITMDGRELDMRAIRFVATPEDGKLELDVYVPGYSQDDETIGNMGFIALDHAIGEYAMETRIGGIGWYPLEDAPADARPLAELITRMPKD